MADRARVMHGVAKQGGPCMGGGACCGGGGGGGGGTVVSFVKKMRNIVFFSKNLFSHNIWHIRMDQELIPG